MIIECLLLSTSLCNSLHFKPSQPKCEGVGCVQTQTRPLFKDKPVMALLATNLMLMSLDYRATENTYQKFGTRFEVDPIIRPLDPHPAALYAFGVASDFAAAWLGHRMRESRHRPIHDLWWVPQVALAGGNLMGYLSNVSKWHF